MAAESLAENVVRKMYEDQSSESIYICAILFCSSN